MLAPLYVQSMLYNSTQSLFSPIVTSTATHPSQKIPHKAYDWDHNGPPNAVQHDCFRVDQDNMEIQTVATWQ